MSCNVAFIGLGVMGYPMAGYISKGGHNVTVYNRTSSKADKWISEYKGSKADTPAKAAEGADFIFTCVGNDNDLREVTFGDNGIFKTIKKGAVYIDNTTASATIAREIYEFSKKNGFGFLFTFLSSFGQSFFLGLFNTCIRYELSITHGQFGSIYASATLLSSFILVWIGKKIDDVNLSLIHI